MSQHSTPTNPPAKHPPRVCIFVDCITKAAPHEWKFGIQLRAYQEVSTDRSGRTSKQYLSMEEHTALLQEERARGRTEMANALLKNLPEGVSLEILEAAIGEALAARSPGDAEKGEKKE